MGRSYRGRAYGDLSCAWNFLFPSLNNRYMVIFMIIIETSNIYIYACFCRYDSFNNRK